MRTYILQLIGLLIIMNCSRSDKSHDNFISKYRKLIKTSEDSVMTVSQDSSMYNALLASLAASSDWKANQKYFKDNPFNIKKLNQNKPRTNVNRTSNSTKRNRKKAIVKSTGLMLTGIIEIGQVKKALIDGGLHKVGDQVHESKIIEIGEKHVTLKNAKGTYKLFLKEKSK